MTTILWIDTQHVMYKDKKRIDIDSSSRSKSRAVLSKALRAQVEEEKRTTIIDLDA